MGVNESLIKFLEENELLHGIYRTDVSCESFSRNMEDIFADALIEIASTRQMKDLLNEFEEKNNMTLSDVVRISGIEKSKYDRLKNQSNNFSSYDHKTMLLLAITFRLNGVDRYRLFSCAHMLIDPENNLDDAVFSFMLTSGEYSSLNGCKTFDEAFNYAKSYISAGR